MMLYLRGKERDMGALRGGAELHWNGCGGGGGGGGGRRRKRRQSKADEGRVRAAIESYKQQQQGHTSLPGLSGTV